MLSNTFIVTEREWYDIQLDKRDVSKDYLRLLNKDGKGITKVGQLLLQESCQAYVYCILGAQAKTRWKIVGDEANSLQTQRVFQDLVTDVVNQQNISLLIKSMRTAIAATKVRLDFCISPGLELLPSDMVFVKDSPGYNNILLVSTSQQKFGVNNVNRNLLRVNYKDSSQDTDNTPHSTPHSNLQRNLQRNLQENYKDSSQQPIKTPINNLKGNLRVDYKDTISNTEIFLVGLFIAIVGRVLWELK